MCQQVVLILADEQAYRGIVYSFFAQKVVYGSYISAQLTYIGRIELVYLDFYCYVASDGEIIEQQVDKLLFCSLEPNRW